MFKMIFKQMELFHFEGYTINQDLECVDLGMYISRLGNWVRKILFPEFVEFGMEKLEYTFKAPLKTKCCENSVLAIFRRDSTVEIDIYVSDILLTVHGRQIKREELPILRTKTIELFNNLSKEYEKYYAENADPDRIAAFKNMDMNDRDTLLDTVHSILASIPRPNLDEPEVSIPEPIPVADQVKELKEEKQDVSSDK
jgi:hypothetical protein